MEKDRISRIESWLKGEQKGPYALDIMPTNRCNLSCLACHQRSISDNSYYENELSTKTYIDIINQASELSVKRIHILGGGEPFIRNDIIDIMKSVKNNNIYGYIVTNGTLFNRENIKQIVDMKWDEIVLSLDSPNAKIHDYLRQKKGTFYKVIKAIKIFNKEKKVQKKESPKVSINYLITNLNYNKLIDMVKLCHKLNIKEIHLMTMLICSEFGKKLELGDKQYFILKFQLAKASVLAKNFNIKNNFKDILRFVKNNGNFKENQDFKNRNINLMCFEPFWHIFIGASGYVVPCSMCLDNCIFPRNDYAEHINEKTLKEIWYGKKFEKFRKNILNKKENKLCSNCCSTILLTSQKDRLYLNLKK